MVTMKYELIDIWLNHKNIQRKERKSQTITETIVSKNKSTREEFELKKTILFLMFFLFILTVSLIMLLF